MPVVFSHLLNMAANASWYILAVLLLRGILKNAPKRLRPVLWGIVALRLLLPFSIESGFSLMPVHDPVRVDAAVYQAPSVANGFEGLNTVFTPGVSVALTDAGVRVGTSEHGVITFYASLIWLAGLAVMLLYLLFSCIRLRRRLCASVRTEENVFLCDHIDTPFVFGLFRPRIYLPSTLEESCREHVLRHEREHIRRLDHLFKPLYFLLLSVYWFHPLVWAAYILFCRDAELACDEAVVRKMPAQERADYSSSLLLCAVQRKGTLFSPAAFGEGNIRQRVKAVLHYKKPTVWVIGGAVVLCAVAAVCFLTCPPDGGIEVSPELEQAVSDAILNSNKAAYYQGECCGEGHIILQAERSQESVKVYCLYTFDFYGFRNGYFSALSGGSGPVVLTFRETGDGLQFEKITYPMDGELYGDSIREMFPPKYWRRALLYSKEDQERLFEQSKRYAESYLESIGRTAMITGTESFLFVSDYGVALTTEQYDRLDELGRKLGTDLWQLGTAEQIEDGVRYFYNKTYDKESGILTFSKSEYESGKTVFYTEINVLTQQVIEGTAAPERIDPPPAPTDEPPTREYTTFVVVMGE